jgi:hypothetical protein
MLYCLAKHDMRAQAAIPCTGFRRSAQFLDHRRTCNSTELQDDHVPAFNPLHPGFETLPSTCYIYIRDLGRVTVRGGCSIFRESGVYELDGGSCGEFGVDV